MPPADLKRHKQTPSPVGPIRIRRNATLAMKLSSDTARAVNYATTVINHDPDAFSSGPTEVGGVRRVSAPEEVREEGVVG